MASPEAAGTGETPVSQFADAAERVVVRRAFCVSAGVLAFEIALMRVLLVVSWHHFAFLVISIGLLGFGFSGTVLLIARRWLMARGYRALTTLALATAVSMPLCMAAAQHVPIEARLVP